VPKFMAPQVDLRGWFAASCFHAYQTDG
jgi:hypothetical protein